MFFLQHQVMAGSLHCVSAALRCPRFCLKWSYLINPVRKHLYTTNLQQEICFEGSKCCSLKSQNVLILNISLVFYQNLCLACGRHPPRPPPFNSAVHKCRSSFTQNTLPLHNSGSNYSCQNNVICKTIECYTNIISRMKIWKTSTLLYFIVLDKSSQHLFWFLILH